MKNRLGLLMTVAGLTMSMLLPGCGAKKKEDASHFGTNANHPKFKGSGDFFKSFGRAYKIMAHKKLDGEPVNMDWIDPAFREKLCLTVTINNHCVG